MGVIGGFESIPPRVVRERALAEIELIDLRGDGVIDEPAFECGIEMGSRVREALEATAAPHSRGTDLPGIRRREMRMIRAAHAFLELFS